MALSSVPVAYTQQPGATNSGQAAQARQLPPYDNLPDIGEMLTEDKNLNRPAIPLPPHKPSTLCGYRDYACKRIKEKEKKKTGQNVQPGKNDTGQMSVSAETKRGSWFSRLRRKVTDSLSFSGSNSSSFNRSNSFLPGATANTTAAALPAAAPPPPPTFTSMNQARLDPRYRVGGASEDLFSGNHHWSLPLVSLPGRNGHDLTLSLHYNSLVWLKQNNTMEFDYDFYDSQNYSTLTPGFRLGLPVIESAYGGVDGYNTYIVILPSGARVNMRQVGGDPNLYEAIDSSYLYLSFNTTNQTATLYTTDGTQYQYSIPSGDWWYRCTKVTDSNGNYLSIAYKAISTQDEIYGIDYITDTLGRVLTFTYDNYFHLATITQNWQGQTFTYAQFNYTNLTIQHNFGGLSVFGPANGSTIPVMNYLVTGDGARRLFVYNSWGQVWAILNYGEINNLRTETDYTFPNTSQPLSDCPRFSELRDYIADWAGANFTGWVSSLFSYDTNETWGQVITPDGVTHKELFSNSGGTRGLSTGMETWHGGQKKKWTTMAWESDSTTSPPVRPRVTETNIYDGTASNRRRTTISYTTVASTVKLPSIVREYNADAVSIYRSTQTDYVTDANYLNRRIIGLPSLQKIYQGDVSGTLVAQTGFVYDSPNDGTTWLQAHGATVRQHDSTNYGTGFLYRGNLTKALRYSVTNGTASSPTETKIGYYTTGNVAWAKDALNHQTTIDYADSFSNSVAPNPATFAYPTKVTDADSFSSTVKYQYDYGVVTETVDPKNYAASQTNPPAKTVNSYDNKGRLERSAVWQYSTPPSSPGYLEYSYTRYVYSTGHNWVQTWSTVNTLAEETAVLHLLDGASRERITLSDHPGSAGGLRAQYVVYNIVGRITERSNPTEINSGWSPSGDDNTYVPSFQSYDWNHRPLVTTNQDGTTRSASYIGCGCAGGLVVEATDEVGRKQKAYSDVFGRTVKTEILDATNAVSSASTTDYNVRDQVTFGRAYQNAATPGSCPTGTCQETKFEYDGYGRTWRRWLPVYKPLSTDPPSTTQYDQYGYFANDTTQSVTDPRGAITTWAYNNRNLVTSISYTVPSGVDATPNVTFNYDANGNRLWMDDGPGRVDYQYNTLSQLEWEKRDFDDLTPDHQLSYEYNLAGQVKKITDPWGASITYGLDKTGRINGVTGSGYADINQWTNRAVTNFATGIKYRAWDDLKEFTNGNFATDKAFFSMGYDSRLRLNRFEGSARITEHDYYPDSRVQQVRTLNNSEYKRTYNYDHAGRMTTANAYKNTGQPNDPYAFTYQYNAFGNTTSRTGTRWNNALPTFTATWTNGRNTNSTHDAAGNQTATTPGATILTQRYDAAGRPSGNTVPTSIFGVNDDSLSYDGDGQVVRQVTEARIGTAPFSTAKRHFVRSSVLGGAVIGEILDKGSLMGSDPNRFENQSNMYLNGERIAYQKYTDRTGPDKEVVWVYKHPVIGSLLETNKLTRLNAQGQPEAMEWQFAWGYFDPLGSDLGYDPASLPPPVQIDDPLSQLQFGDITNYGNGCTIDGVRGSCDKAIDLVNSGFARVKSIDRWFGLNPGDPAYIPVWSASGFQPGQYGDKATTIFRLGFVRGYSTAQAIPYNRQTRLTVNDLQDALDSLGEGCRKAIAKLLKKRGKKWEILGDFSMRTKGIFMFFTRILKRQRIFH